MYEVSCRQCSAAVGEPCRTVGGRVVTREPHTIRVKDAATSAITRAQADLDLAHSVACSYCSAGAGDPCRTACGTIDRSTNPHSIRLAEAKKARRLAGDPNQGVLL